MAPTPLRASLRITAPTREEALRHLRDWRPPMLAHCRDLALPPYAGRREFRFEADGCVLGDLTCARQRTDRVTGVSGNGAGRDPVVVQYVLAGRVWFSGPSTFSIGPGQLAVRDTARPWRFWSAHATVTRWLLVPRAVLLGHRHGALPASHVEDDTPDVRFLVSYLEMLTGTTALSDEGARAAQDATLSLLAGVLAGRPGAEAHEHARATVVLARRFIDRHLRDRDVTPALLARQLGVSPRTLHRSFSSEGDSVMGYVRRRRLHEARRELVTAGASARVADVAARWRFADSSHFTRQFRGTYGTTPAAFLRSL